VAAVTEAAWQAHHDRLRAFVSRRVASPADAEDIVQGVFLRLHRSLASLREADRLVGWLYHAARNAIADHYRAPARRREVPSGDARDMEAVGGSVAPEDDRGSSARSGAADCLQPLIERLPERYRRAIDLVERQGMSQGAAARAEGLSLSGMKARIQRARRRLEAGLQECCRLLFDTRGAVRGCAPRSPAGAHCVDGPAPPVGCS
jgi:RNA polymerase sigma-70 factor (ECF subfamily)